MLTWPRPWFLGVTVGLILGAVLGAASVSRGTAGRGNETLEVRVQALEAALQGLQGLIDHVSFVQGPLNGLSGPHLLFEGINVHIRSGSGSTDDGAPFPTPPGALFGLGNLIIGYNAEPPALADGERGGSHTLIIGDEHRHTSWGGLVAGFHNMVSGPWASVSGGESNTASGLKASVSGGQENLASGEVASVSGGWVNSAKVFLSTVSGGINNTANGSGSTVSGGKNRTAPNADDWVAGSLIQDN